MDMDLEDYLQECSKIIQTLSQKGLMGWNLVRVPTKKDKRFFYQKNNKKLHILKEIYHPYAPTPVWKVCDETILFGEFIRKTQDPAKDIQGAISQKENLLKVKNTLIKGAIQQKLPENIWFLWDSKRAEILCQKTNRIRYTLDPHTNEILLKTIGESVSVDEDGSIKPAKYGFDSLRIKMFQNTIECTRKITHPRPRSMNIVYTKIQYHRNIKTCDSSVLEKKIIIPRQKKIGATLPDLKVNVVKELMNRLYKAVLDKKGWTNEGNCWMHPQNIRAEIVVEKDHR